MEVFYILGTGIFTVLCYWGFYYNTFKRFRPNWSFAFIAIFLWGILFITLGYGCLFPNGFFLQNRPNNCNPQQH